MAKAGLGLFARGSPVRSSPASCARWVVYTRVFRRAGRQAGTINWYSELNVGGLSWYLGISGPHIPQSVNSMAGHRAHESLWDGDLTYPPYDSQTKRSLNSRNPKCSEAARYKSLCSDSQDSKLLSCIITP